MRRIGWIGALGLVLLGGWKSDARAEEKPAKPEAKAEAPMSPDAVITEAPGEAAARLEKLARDNPDAPLAEQALVRAIALRIRFAEPRQVERDVALYRKLFGGTSLQAAEVELMYGRHLVRAEQRRVARRVFSRKLPLDTKLRATLLPLTKHSSPTIRWPALVLWAHHAQHRNDLQAGLAAFHQVNREFSTIRKLNEHLDTLGGDRATERKRRKRTLDAVAKSMFEIASRARAQLSMDVPEIVKDGEVKLHIATHVGPWMKEVRAEAQKVSRLYDRLGRLRAHAPKWQLRARSDQAMMWASVVAAFRAGPYPREWDRDGFVPGVDPPLLWAELRSSYLAKLDETSEPFKRRAKRAMHRCLRTGAELQTFDASLQHCEEWLSKNYPSEYPLADEFKPQVGLIGTTVRSAPSKRRH